MNDPSWQGVRENVEQLSCAAFDVSSPANRNLFQATLENHVGTNSEKRITSNALATLYGFKQERLLLPGRDAEKGGDWRQQISHYRLDDRNQSGGPREILELFELWSEHQWRKEQIIRGMEITGVV